MMAVTQTTNPETTQAANRPKAVKAQNNQRFFVPTDMPAICQLWLFRLLLKRANLHRYLQQEEMINEGVLATFGLSEHILQVSKPGMVNFILQAKCRELAADPKVGIPRVLASNIFDLAVVIGLNHVEQQLLALAVLVTTDHGLRMCASDVNVKQHSCLEKTLQIMLDCPADKVKAALQARGALSSSGLLTLQVPNTLDDVFDFITPKLANELQQLNTSPLGLLRHLWQPAPQSTLNWLDFEHLQTELLLLRSYLKQAVFARKAGVNVLLYGPPGTGKTELARLMAGQVVGQMYQVSSEDEEGDVISGEQRLRAYQFAQRCLASGEHTVLIFDEAEDVFAQNPFSRSFVNRKGWMNQLLEQNPLPCFWLTNDISCMDNAAIRRFDMVIEVSNVPKAQRARVLQNASEAVLSANDVLNLAAHPELTPAVITRSCDVVNQVFDTESTGNLDTETQQLRQQNVDETMALRLLIDSTLKAQGFDPKSDIPRACSDIYYPAFINADVDIESLVNGLKHAGNARICLYGPPGSGKTAFCQYLAEQLEKPLLFKPASQLLGSYVGQSERLIAKAFAEATVDNAVLLLDEVDSFLQQREKAQQSWQITQVNELLQQMERFNGILLATTNQLPQLDQASLRRFDLIIQFDYLTPEQAMDLLETHCIALNLPMEMTAFQQLQQMVMLTPGDFRAIVRQARFRPLTDADAFVAELQKTIRLKGGSTVVMPEQTNRLQ
jgi:SpoVK/Ycf46/Vps4 family AAA+-type ATPase